MATFYFEIFQAIYTNHIDNKSKLKTKCWFYLKYKPFIL